MRQQRSFTVEFKRQMIEELLSGISTAAQLSRRHHISSGLLYHWKKPYAKSGFGAEPAQEVAREERVRQLEQMVGRLTLENEFLKKALQRSLAHVDSNGRSWPPTGPCSPPPRGGAHS
jgi:transposase